MDRKALMHEAAIKIRAASNLGELLEAVCAFRAACTDKEWDEDIELREYGINMNDLPTFGGEEPPDSELYLILWSWDATNLMVSDYDLNWKIIPRENGGDGFLQNVG